MASDLPIAVALVKTYPLTTWVATAQGRHHHAIVAAAGGIAAEAALPPCPSAWTPSFLFPHHTPSLFQSQPPCSWIQSPLRAHFRQFLPVATRGPAAALPQTPVAVAARAVSVAFLTLPLLRPLPTFSTRVACQAMALWPPSWVSTLWSLETE